MVWGYVPLQFLVTYALCWGDGRRQYVFCCTLQGFPYASGKWGGSIGGGGSNRLVGVGGRQMILLWGGGGGQFPAGWITEN